MSEPKKGLASLGLDNAVRLRWALHFHEAHVDQDLEVFRADRYFFRALARYARNVRGRRTASLSSRLPRPVFGSVMFGSNPGWLDRPEYTGDSAPKGDNFEANQRAAFLAPGLAPSNDGRPRVSRTWAIEPFPKSGKLSNASPDISRSSSTVFMPGANSAFYVRVGLGGSVCHPEVPSGVNWNNNN